MRREGFRPIRPNFSAQSRLARWKHLAWLFTDKWQFAITKPVPKGFVAQTDLRSDFPFPRTDSAYSDSFRYAKSGISVEDRRADLDLRDLAIKISSGHGLRLAISDSLKPAFFGYLAQTAESDLNLLTRMARDLDATAKWATGLQRASYQRRKLAQRIPVKGCSFWATPTFKGSGNRACIVMSPAGMAYKTDQNQVGSQIGLKNQASSWTLLWMLLKPPSKHSKRGCLNRA